MFPGSSRDCCLPFSTGQVPTLESLPLIGVIWLPRGRGGSSSAHLIAAYCHTKVRLLVSSQASRKVDQSCLCSDPHPSFCLGAGPTATSPPLLRCSSHPGQASTASGSGKQAAKAGLLGGESPLQSCYASARNNNMLRTLLSLVAIYCRNCICYSWRTLSSSQTLSYTSKPEKHKQLLSLLLCQQSCRQCIPPKHAGHLIPTAGAYTFWTEESKSCHLHSGRNI